MFEIGFSMATCMIVVYLSWSDPSPSLAQHYMMALDQINRDSSLPVWRAQINRLNLASLNGPGFLYLSVKLYDYQKKIKTDQSTGAKMELRPCKQTPTVELTVNKNLTTLQSNPCSSPSKNRHATTKTSSDPSRSLQLEDRFEDRFYLQVANFLSMSGTPVGLHDAVSSSVTSA